jgi:hypothetical protein
VQASLTGWLLAAVLSRQYCSSAAKTGGADSISCECCRAGDVESEDIGWKLLRDPASRKLLEEKVGTASIWHSCCWVMAQHMVLDCPSHNQQTCNCSVRRLLIHCSPQCSS